MAIVLDLQALTPPANDMYAGRSSIASTGGCCSLEPVEPGEPIPGN
jgi:hypothetical protein